MTTDTTATAFQSAIEAGRKKELKGVEGWLLIRVIVYLAVNPISLISDPSALGFAVTAILFVAGIYLVRLNPVGVKLAKIGEGITIGTGLFFMVVGLSGKLNMDVLSTGSHLAASGGIWLLYFYRSRRVRNTYFPQPVQSEIAVAVKA